MELQDLYKYTFALLMVGIMVGVAVLVFSNMNKAVRTTTTIQDDAVNLSTDIATLSQTYCKEFVSATYANGTAVSTATFDWSNKDACVMTSNVPDNNVKYNVTYTYGALNKAATSQVNMVTAVSPIATTWIALIVTIVVLSLILHMVVSSFGAAR